MGRNDATSEWEYRLISTQDVPGAGRFKGPTREQAEGFLNALGEEGWEVVNVVFYARVTSFFALAKRRR